MPRFWQTQIKRNYAIVFRIQKSNPQEIQLGIAETLLFTELHDGATNTHQLMERVFYHEHLTFEAMRARRAKADGGALFFFHGQHAIQAI